MWAFDLDGCVADSFPAMEARIGKYLDCSWSPENPMPYNPQNYSYDITSDKILEIFSCLVREDAIPPMEGAIDVLRDYYAKTNRMVFITHRHDPDVEALTRKWLDKVLGIPYELYACHHCDKALFAKDIGITGFVDDYPAICQTFVREGMNTLCYNSPWHIYMKDSLKGLKVVFSWDDIRKEIF